MLDTTRLLAAVGVIWLHVGGTLPTVVGRFAVPFFAASVGFLVTYQATRKPGASFSGFVAKRAHRLLGPFAVWAVIYGVVRTVGSSVTTHVTPVDWSPALLVTGTSHHLWFLPFAFVVSLVAFGLAGAARNAPTAWFVALCAAAGAVAAIESPFPTSGGWYTVHLSYNALPAALAGIALGLAYAHELPSRPRPSLGYAWLVVAFVVGMIAAEVDRSVPLENAAGVAALLASLVNRRPPWAAALARWPALAYGVYLSHILFLEGLQDAFAIVGFPVGLANDLFVFAGATAMSLAFALVASRLGWRTLAGG